jgi:hypothetical protein
LSPVNVGRRLRREMYRQKANLYHFREQGDFRCASCTEIVLSKTPTCNGIWQLCNYFSTIVFPREMAVGWKVAAGVPSPTCPTYLQSRRKMEAADTTTIDVNDVIASSHWFAIGYPELQGPTWKSTMWSFFANHFSGYPRPRKAKVKTAGESVYLGEMTRRIWQSLPPLSASFSPKVDKGLNSEHPTISRRKIWPVCKGTFCISCPRSTSLLVYSSVQQRLQLSGHHEG